MNLDSYVGGGGQAKNMWRKNQLTSARGEKSDKLLLNPLANNLPSPSSGTRKHTISRRNHDEVHIGTEMSLKVVERIESSPERNNAGDMVKGKGKVGHARE